MLIMHDKNVEKDYSFLLAVWMVKEANCVDAAGKR